MSDPIDSLGGVPCCEMTQVPARQYQRSQGSKDSHYLLYVRWLEIIHCISSILECRFLS